MNAVRRVVLKVCGTLGLSLGLGLLGAGGALAQPSQSSPPVVLKVAHFYPPTSNAHARVLLPWLQRVEAASGGRLRFQVFPAMTLGGTPSQLFDQARDGVADIVITLPGYTPGRFPKSEVFELPLMVQSGSQGSRAAWDYAQRHLQAEFAGVRLLSVHTHDPGVLHLVKRPVQTLEDLRGSKLRAPTRVATRLLAALGATPVAVPFTALHDSLGKGLLDGLLITWEALPSTRIDDLVRVHVEMPPGAPALYTSTLIVAMNPARYNSLPADLRAVIDQHSGAELGEAFAGLWDRTALEARAKAQTAGNRMVTLSAAEYARWQTIAAQVRREWVAELQAKGIDAPQLLAEAERLLAQYAPKSP